MTTNSNQNQALQGIRRASDKIDEMNFEMENLMRRQAHGEDVNGEEFMRLVEKRITAGQAMQAQLRLHEKPLKTVLNESK